MNNNPSQALERRHPSRWVRTSALAAVALGCTFVVAACGDDDTDTPDGTDIDPVTSDVTATSVVTEDSEVTIGTTMSSEVEVTDTVTETSDVEVTETITEVSEVEITSGG